MKVYHEKCNLKTIDLISVFETFFSKFGDICKWCKKHLQIVILNIEILVKFTLSYTKM